MNVLRNYLLLLVALALIAAGCTNKPDAIRTLHSAGFKDVETTGYSWFACGQDDTSHTGFIATNPAGERVTGTVCCGLIFKACTIRF